MTDAPLTLPGDSPYRLIIEGRALSPAKVGAECLPLRSIARPEIRERVKGAGLILGWDTRTRRLIVFYGAEIWGEFLRRHETEWTAPLVIGFQYDSDLAKDDLEYLVAAVRTLKGSCCYE